MTAQALLATLQARGIRVRRKGGFLAVAPGDALTNEEAALVRQLKTDLLALVPAEKERTRADRPEAKTTPMVALRVAYRRWFSLVVMEADGDRTDPDESRAVHQDIVRLTDDVGVLFADAIYADELLRFRLETARCGACGNLGHDQPKPPIK